MKKMFFASFLLLFVLGCANADAKAEVKLNTMVCGMCASSISDKISSLAGVVKVEIDEENKIGIFTYKASIIDLSSIENAIASLGYSANKTKADPNAYEALASCCKIGSK